MDVLIILAIVIVLIFGFVVFFGAPYLPTLRKDSERALDLLDLEPGQTVIDLGSGDGAFLIAAARRGLIATGYELNPLLCAISRLRTRRYGSRVTVKWGNFWSADLPQADGVYVFLLDRFMSRLDGTITRNYSGKSLRLVSNTFKLPARTVSIRKKNLLLYIFD